MEKQKRFQGKATTWLDFENPAASDLETIRRVIPSIEALDLADTAKVGQRPHLEKRPHYTFLVLLFPVYNRATREIEPAEVDFLITNDTLVTTHDGRLEPLTNLLTEVHKSGPLEHTLLTETPAAMLITILERLLAYCNPMLDHVSVDLRSLEQHIFKGDDSRRTVREILLMRRNVTDFRKIMSAHKNTLKKLVTLVDAAQPERRHELNLAVESLITRTRDIWDHLESFKETVVDLHATNESLLSNKLNNIMRNYTTISVVIFTMTLATSLFAIRAPGTPLVDNPIGFWLVSIMLVFIGLGMLEYFRHRKWI